jgi:hypothetical protein
MVLEYAVKALCHDPVKLGFGETQAQRMEYRQPMNDVSKRAGLYDENFTRV